MTFRVSFDKSKVQILLLENIHPNAVEVLRENDYKSIVEHPKSLPENALIEALAGTHFLGIRSQTQVTERVLRHAPKLMAVGCFCIGVNQVDLDVAAELGIPVFNAPFSNTRSVAELVIAETILLMRNIASKNAGAHRGDWIKSAAGSFEVRGKTLGIVGYGNIGKQVGILAEHLGMRVTFYDTDGKLPLGNARQVPTLDALLAESDVVTLHVPETSQTLNMIGAAQLARMRQGSHLINASRGTVVDIDALADALERKHIGGAALDVFPVEPKANDDRFESPLTRFDNVILTPHIGGSTAEAQANIGIEVTDKLVRYSDNGTTLTAVNFPEVTLPEHPGMCRLLHIHRNVPGVLARINERFGARGINITGQYLQTAGHIGYCVMDIEGAGCTIALEELQSIPGTIRCRLLF
ncbi:MAG: phosphoglycerate dehydrogenase [Proteobacteria bacterium]|nr:phosphoglycerate dehydrogenase [Burkholderiales bacterium]